jgi:hypothetical protein
MRHKHYIIPGCPPQTLPKFPRLPLLATNKEMTLGNPKGSQPLQDSICESSAESLAPVSWRHCKVLEVAPPTVGTCQNGPN